MSSYVRFGRRPSTHEAVVDHPTTCTTSDPIVVAGLYSTYTTPNEFRRARATFVALGLGAMHVLYVYCVHTSV